MKIIALLSAMGLLFLWGCDIADPHLPSWDIDLSVPLMNERFLVSELVDSVNIVVNEDDILTITGTGSAETPPFGHVNYTPSLLVEGVPLYAGAQLDMNFPIQDPAGLVFICYGRFAQGSLNYRFQINDPTHSNVTIQFPDFHYPSGDPFEFVSGANTNWQNLNLVDCYFGNENSPNVFDSLLVHFIVTSDQPAGTQIGTFSIQANSQLGFDKFQGYLYDYIRSVQGTISTINIDYPLDIDQAIQLQHANVILHVTNEIGFGAEFHGQIRATNHRTGQVRTINVLDDSGLPFSVTAADETGPSISYLNFSNNVSQLLQIMPDQIEVFDAYMLINGGHGEFPGTVEETQQLYVTYQVDAPLEIILYEHTFELTEAIEIQAPTDLPSQVDDIREASMKLGLTNHIPVGFTATIYVAPQPEIDITDPSTYSFVKMISIHSSEYTGPDVDEDGEQMLTLALTKPELDVFLYANSYLLLTFSFEATDGPVTIYASPADYLQIRGMLSVKYRIEGVEA